jgi:hypothetical protein
MRPAGLLDVWEITAWLGGSTSNRCRATHKLLAREGIKPVVRGHQRIPSLWRFADLEPLRHRAPSARGDDLEAAA